MTDDPRETRLEALTAALGDELMAALARRGRSQRSLENRSTLARMLRGENYTLSTLVDFATTLGCSVEIRLVDGAIDGTAAIARDTVGSDAP